MKYEDKKKNINIIADEINIGNNVSFGENVHISLKGTFSIGNYSRLGNNVQILGNNVIIGEHLFHSSGLRIGGGGRQHPNANLKIGDRCTIHNNFINICEPVEIGNDVGFSQDVSIITHGYWLSVLDGYPAAFAGVNIGNGVIVGYRTVLLMGVRVANHCVIGAQSTVSKSLTKKGIYVGSPAKFIKEIIPLSKQEKEKKIFEIIQHYLPIAQYHGLNPNIMIDFPKIKIDDLNIDAETFEYSGVETEVTDDFRDYIRKWGIRIYTERPFRSVYKIEEK